MYFLFIMVMIGLGAVLLEQYGNLFLLILGAVIAIAGLINLKDYFWFKQGVSLSPCRRQEQRTITQKAGRIVRKLGNEAGNHRHETACCHGQHGAAGGICECGGVGLHCHFARGVYDHSGELLFDTQAIGGMACYSLVDGVLRGPVCGAPGADSG
jgi:purine-cytosine permease-like protein